VLFFSSIPIAILMNSLRIGAIGITVEHWGKRMAEGLLHDFEGWVVFMLSTAALLGVAAVLKPKWLTLRDSFSQPETVLSARRPPGPTRQPLPRPFIGATALLALTAALHFLLPERTEVTPARESLVDFPTQVAGWYGQRTSMEEVYVEALKLDDYLMANYRRDGEKSPLNFYVAWYDSQRSGRSVHSPRACMPGGGWQITSLEERDIEVPGSGTLHANRALIELGGSRQVVYYWFEQRGRRLSSEYLVKWYIFWDALTRNRSDGALVRLSMPVRDIDGVEQADKDIGQFAAAAVPLLRRYVPD
jgi:exosortase D (VPLPA-CTERM-specific)